MINFAIDEVRNSMKEIMTQVLAESLQIGDKIMSKSENDEEEIIGIVEEVVILNRIFIRVDKRKLLHWISFALTDKDNQSLRTISYQSKDVISKIITI